MKNLLLLNLIFVSGYSMKLDGKEGISFDSYYKQKYNPRDGKYDQDHLNLGIRPRESRSSRVAEWEDKDYWYNDGQAELAAQLAKTPIETKAKNIIFFLADGTGVGTMTAGRLAKGYKSQNFERETMAWEKFPYSALIKTYNTDMQVTDSAASSTAYSTGSKANQATLGVDINVMLGDCVAGNNPLYHTKSVLSDFQDDNRSTGIVTTTRVTHASPAGNYAHIGERHWENDDDINDMDGDSLNCDDIAEQLVLDATGRKMKVIMGGGRRGFRSKDFTDDPEGCDLKRDDQRDLIQDWVAIHSAQGTPSYVWHRDELLAMDPSQTDFLLGLFDCSHMEFAVDADTSNPTLEEMTIAAIDILSKDPNGYFLFVEGGLIDKAHHLNEHRSAMEETLEFEKAVAAAVAMTSENDTLIIVTADHSQPIQINGYSSRESDVLGLATELSDFDGMAFSTLMYTNGPGFRDQVSDLRPDPETENWEDPHYMGAAAIPNVESYHSGEDVALFARGPFAHLFTGMHENSYIPHALRYAACVGTGLNSCGTAKEDLN